MNEKRKKILIAEDEHPLAHALQLKLESVGFDVVVVGNGNEALAKVKDGAFDLFILDLMMPEKDGFGVLQDMQQQGNKTPVIVASNLSQEEDIVRAKKLGARDYFIKSNISISEIINRIEAVLKK